MIVQIQPPSGLIQKVLRPQVSQEDDSYRISSWVIPLCHNNKEYLYNVLTKELVYIENESLTYNEELIKRWFLVESDFSEFKLVSQVKRMFSILHSRNTGVTNYTIFTTTACNARCYYCFERYGSKVVLRDNMCNEIISFIIRNSNNKHIYIQWFGGEPLLNTSSIDRICIGLKNAGISYDCSITTNGYLFSQDVITKAKNLWMLDKAQITIDGTKDNYNRIKNYIYDNKNPFAKVLNNIQVLLDNGIRVDIRLNVSLDNCTDLSVLIHQIYENFGKHPLLKIYTSPIFELVNDINAGTLVDKLNQLQNIISSYNLDKSYGYFTNNRINHCKADNNGQSVVIFPDGNLGWCEHEWEKDYIGNVLMFNKTNEQFKHSTRWREYNVFERCEKCMLFPDCLKLSRCDTNSQCISDFIAFDLRIIRDTMIKKIDSYEAQV